MHVCAKYKHGYGGFRNEKKDGNTKADSSALQMAVEEVEFGTFLGNCEEEAGQGRVVTIDRGCNFITKMNCPGIYHGGVGRR